MELHRAQWPSVAGDVKPPNAELRLYGGAAFERALNEFQEAAHMLEFPIGQSACAEPPCAARLCVPVQRCRKIAFVGLGGLNPLNPDVPPLEKVVDVLLEAFRE